VQSSQNENYFVAEGNGTEYHESLLARRGGAQLWLWGASMATQESTATGWADKQITTGGHGQIVRTLAGVEGYLWGVLVVALLADVVLTGYGLQHGLSEGNPAMRLAIDVAGIAALLGAKLAVVGFGVAVRQFLGDRGAVVPLGLAVPWVGAATVNAVLLL